MLNVIYIVHPKTCFNFYDLQHVQGCCYIGTKTGSLSGIQVPINSKQVNK